MAAAGAVSGALLYFMAREFAPSRHLGFYRAKAWEGIVGFLSYRFVSDVEIREHVGPIAETVVNLSVV